MYLFLSIESFKEVAAGNELEDRGRACTKGNPQEPPGCAEALEGRKRETKDGRLAQASACAINIRPKTGLCLNQTGWINDDRLRFLTPDSHCYLLQS